VGETSGNTRATGVVLLTTSWPVPGHPASGVFVWRLARHLAAHLPLTVVTPAGQDRAPDTNTPGLRVRAVRYAPRRWRVLAQTPGGIPAALRAHPLRAMLVPGLVVALACSAWRACRPGTVLHANWAISGVIAGLVGRLRRRPVLTTLRGSDVARAAHRVTDRWLLRLAARLSARLCAVSPGLAAEASALLPGTRTRIEVVPNGVDDSLFDLSADRAAGDAGLSLVSVGSLVESKALGVVLKALAACTGTRLTVVGEGPARAGLEARVRALGLDARVHFTGVLEPVQVVSELARAQVFVTASRREGRSNALLEAMAAALPAVAADIAATRDLVEDGVSGLLFPVDDVAALSACLERLRDQAERARLGAGARARIRALGLTWANAAQHYARLYDQLAAQAAAR